METIHLIDSKSNILADLLPAKDNSSKPNYSTIAWDSTKESLDGSIIFKCRDLENTASDLGIGAVVKHKFYSTTLIRSFLMRILETVQKYFGPTRQHFFVQLSGGTQSSVALMMVKDL